jgi:predicted nucleic acid-binding protein
MIRPFADTSYFLALLLPSDENHERARRVSAQIRRNVLTSEYVVVEVGNFLSAPAMRQRFGVFMDSLRRNPNLEIVPASARILRQAIDLYLNRRDKGWALTDCTSFVIMGEQGVHDALTTDYDFEQAGFHNLL